MSNTCIHIQGISVYSSGIACNSRLTSSHRHSFMETNRQDIIIIRCCYWRGQQPHLSQTLSVEWSRLSSEHVSKQPVSLSYLLWSKPTEITYTVSTVIKKHNLYFVKIGQMVWASSPVVFNTKGPGWLIICSNVLVCTCTGRPQLWQQQSQEHNIPHYHSRGKQNSMWMRLLSNIFTIICFRQRLLMDRDIFFVQSINNYGHSIFFCARNWQSNNFPENIRKC